MADMEQQVSSHLKSTILQEQRGLLVSNLTVDRHMDFLRSKYILSEDDCEEICAEKTRRKRASRFLDIMLTKGPAAFDAFLEALRQDGTQTFLLESLNRDYENRIYNFRDLMAPQRNRPLGRVIPPPPMQPPPPPNPTLGSRFVPTEHHSSQGIIPSDFSENLFRDSCTSTSVCTPLTDLSSGKLNLPRQESCGQDSTKTSHRMIDTLDILRSISSSQSSASEGMSSVSSPSIGIPESDRPCHLSGLFTRGNSHNEKQKLSEANSPTLFPSETNSNTVPEESCSADDSGVCYSTTDQSPVSEVPEDTEFFSSLPQSWVETSSGIGSLGSHTQGQRTDWQTSANEYKPPAGEVTMQEMNNNFKASASNSQWVDKQDSESQVARDFTPTDKNSPSQNPKSATSFCFPQTEPNQADDFKTGANEVFSSESGRHFQSNEAAQISQNNFAKRIDFTQYQNSSDC